MVFFFTIAQHPDFRVYMGKDKFENEHLIRWGHPEGALPEEVIKEMCQLVKQNSIEGSKKDTVDVVYTRWSNLKKRGDMEIGQVGFKDEKLVRRVKHVARDKVILKRLEKTKTEAFPDLEKERADRDQEEINQRRRDEKQQKLLERQSIKDRAAEKALKTYASLHSKKALHDAPTMDVKGDTTISSCREIEEDFM